MKKPHAFTLIELLVVIAIIAILAGLLLPVLGASIERGRASQCSKNLASIGSGINMYLADNDNRMFSLAASASDPVLGTTSGGWPGILQASYVKDWNSFRSPFDKTSPTRPSVTSTTVPPVPVSYGLSAKVFDTVKSRWRTPDSLVFLAAPAIDTTATGQTVQFLTNAVSNYNVNITIPTGANLGTHQSRKAINVLFADGHVEQWTWNNYILNGTNTQQQHWDPMYQSTQAPQ